MAITRYPGRYEEFLSSDEPGTPIEGRMRVYSAEAQARSFLHTVGEHGISLRLARDNVFVCRAEEDISRGEAVYISGATGNIPQVSLAQADSEDTMPALGIAIEDMDNNDFGLVMTQGRLEGINTTGGGEGWTEGDRLFISTTVPGGLTNVSPEAPNYIQRLALVANAGVSGALILYHTVMKEPSEGADLTAIHTDQAEELYDLEEKVVLVGADLLLLEDSEDAHNKKKVQITNLPSGGAGTPASSVTDETSWGISPAVGTSTNYARQDHTHGSPTDPGAGGLSQAQVLARGLGA